MKAPTARPGDGESMPHSRTSRLLWDIAGMVISILLAAIIVAIHLGLLGKH